MNHYANEDQRCAPSVRLLVRWVSQRTDEVGKSKCKEGVMNAMHPFAGEADTGRAGGEPAWRPGGGFGDRRPSMVVGRFTIVGLHTAAVCEDACVINYSPIPLVRCQRSGPSEDGA